MPREALSTGFLIFEPLLETQGFDHSIRNLLSGTFMWYYLFLILFSVKCLGGSWDIFGNGRTSSLVFDSLRESSVAFGNRLKQSGIVVTWSRILNILYKMILAFLEPFLLLTGKNDCSKEFYTVRVKMRRI